MGRFNSPRIFKEFTSARDKFRPGVELEIWSDNFVISTSFSSRNSRPIISAKCMEELGQKRLRKGLSKRVLGNNSSSIKKSQLPNFFRGRVLNRKRSFDSYQNSSDIFLLIFL